MTTRIAIVGAGCAGLGAATELMGQKETAVDVTLIDANDWIGGRAYTWSEQPNLPVDLGPQFIQDPGVNPWAVIMAQMPKYAGKGVSPEIDSLYRIREGVGGWSTVSFKAGIEKGKELLAESYQAATGFKNAPTISAEEAQVFKTEESLRLALGSSDYGSIAESAEPWQYVARDKARQTGYDAGSNIYVAGGLGNLVMDYGKQLLSCNPLALHWLNKTVSAIDGTGSQELDITTGDEDPIKADFCIVTAASPEILKIKFDPPLPGPMTRALSFIKLGSYKKVAFRPTKFPGNNDKNAINKDVEYYIYDQEHGGVWQYFRLPTKPDMLICVAAGDFARWLDSQDDSEVSGFIISLLTEAYPDGNFTPQDVVCIVSNWTKMANIHGAYSYTHYDDKLDRDNPVPLEARLEIAKPHGRIHFAGEATWPDAYGTIHGAYLSGVRAAREILAAVKSG